MVQAWMVSGFGLIGRVSVLIHLPGRLRPLELRAVSKRNEQGADDPGLDRD